jgi:hypothetical protein
MATSPVKASVRAYDVGFGDCFLLTFHYAGGDKHLLIDFGSMRKPKGKAGTGKYMERIAAQIAADCGGKLTAVIATHRHRDHISGFTMSGTKGPGAVIRGLKPEIVLQPWTEDPKAARDADRPTKGLKGVALRTRLHMKSLKDMNRYASGIGQFARKLRGRHLKEVREQLEFLGDDNGLANRSAVVNLMTMGKRKARYLFSGAPSGLEPLLPGVKVHVLGPPTLQQDKRVATQTDEQENEFWHLRAGFWARRASVTNKVQRDAPLFPKVLRKNIPWAARWFVYQAQLEASESMLSIVRTLDDAMNNTSLILLFEFKDQCLLFPGDAQWENWRYALENQKTKYEKLLARVNLYKVGHHGSLNATPISLWKQFSNTGATSKVNRLATILSTMNDVHGHAESDTEVPRDTLVNALREKSNLTDTRETGSTALSVMRTVP